MLVLKSTTKVLQKSDMCKFFVDFYENFCQMTASDSNVQALRGDDGVYPASRYSDEQGMLFVAITA